MDATLHRQTTPFLVRFGVVVSCHVMARSHTAACAGLSGRVRGCSHAHTYRSMCSRDRGNSSNRQLPHIPVLLLFASYPAEKETEQASNYLARKCSVGTIPYIHTLTCKGACVVGLETLFPRPTSTTDFLFPPRRCLIGINKLSPVPL